jgi:hypothetical protein
MESLNFSDMNSDYTQLEILLVTDSNYLRREWIKKEELGIPNQFSYKILLAEACCDGLLAELLPELFKKPIKPKKWYENQTRQAKSFIDIEIGDFPIAIQSFFTLYPYSFMEEKCLN